MEREPTRSMSHGRREILHRRSVQAYECDEIPRSWKGEHHFCGFPSDQGRLYNCACHGIGTS